MGTGGVLYLRSNLFKFFNILAIIIMVQLADILGLSVAERIAMAEAIWDSIKKEEVSLSAAQLEELDHRMSLHDSGEMPFVSWNEVKAELRIRKQYQRATCCASFRIWGPI